MFLQKPCKIINPVFRFLLGPEIIYRQGKLGIFWFLLRNTSMTSLRRSPRFHSHDERNLHIVSSPMSAHRKQTRTRQSSEGRDNDDTQECLSFKATSNSSQSELANTIDPESSKRRKKMKKGNEQNVSDEDILSQRSKNMDVPNTVATTTMINKNPTTEVILSLPRNRETEVLTRSKNENDRSNKFSYVIGVDEAGRGPLAGPVVAAAILSTTTTIDGICDSKRIHKEHLREEVYHRLISSPGIRYAIAVVDAETIDKVNILQATYQAMKMATSGVIGLDTIRYESKLSIQHKGCYVVRNNHTDKDGKVVSGPLDVSEVYTLIDGNRMPPNFPTEAETIIHGDDREYLIAAASILAKVSRDRLMHEYDKQYPHFLFGQHKGYGTAKHMSFISQYGPLPIHRKTFAPLKHMNFEEKMNEE
jgi:ribonuclease HII